MTDYPKVSVVTITYGHENYITQTLDSVLVQDYPGEIEFIIANDNSPDQTDEVITKYFETIPIPVNFEIKYTKHEANKGMMLNFIWAMQQASGKYLALCEGDDYWIDPLKLQKQVGFLETHNDFSMSFHAAKDYIQTTHEFKCKTPLQTREYHGEEFLKNWLIPTASVMFRKEYLDKQIIDRLVNPNYIYGDTILFLSMEEKGKIFCFNEVMSIYRIHDTSMVRVSSQRRKIGDTYFINHHRQMALVFNGRYKKINYRIISEQYYEYLLKARRATHKARYLLKFNYYVIMESRKLFFSIEHIKTTLYHLMYIFKKGK